MSRAYICLVRNDLDSNLLQVLDLKPNTSQQNPSLSTSGQTGYVTWVPQVDQVSVSDSGAGVWVTDAAYYGLAAYCLDNIENVNGGADIALTASKANAIRNALTYKVIRGLPLTLAAINTAINAVAGIADSDLNGVVADSFSTGTVEEVLRILSGEVYYLPAGSAISDAANAFHEPHTRKGSFLAVGDTGFRNFRKIGYTGSLSSSLLTGSLSKLKAAGFSWINPSYTYGSAGTAVAGNTVSSYANIPSTGVWPAVAVYDNAGNAI